MTKARMHPALLEFRGAMGDMLFRKQNGKVYVSIKPDMSNTKPTQAQTAQRDRFREAVAYGKIVMADPEVRAVYEQASKDKGVPTFALTVADFLNAPSIKDVDVSVYNGNIGDLIKVKATDDFGVASVHVSITDAQSEAPIENGDAMETAPGSGLWLYSATTAVPANTTVSVHVVATDRPGGTAVDTQTKSL